MNKKKIKGIFILGSQRSGTTMLANILACQKKVCGVTLKNHWGILESCFFTLIEGRYGPLNIQNNYLEFVSVMSKYNYIQLMQLKFDKLKKLKPKSYKNFFLLIYEIYSKKKKSKLLDRKNS